MIAFENFTNFYPNIENGKFFYINNRRYLGNKYKLHSFITNVIKTNIKRYYSICDIFAGTGSVSFFLNSFDNKIIVNDILYSNYVTLKSFLGITKINYKVIEEKIDYLNNLKNSEDNYFSQIYGNSYFSLDNAKKIGTIRDEIDKISESIDEKYVLLTSLIYATDKVANTVGHYDAFCKKMINNKKLHLLIPFINNELNQNNEIFRKDATQFIKEIKCDILYLDPPYNSRQYNSAYHVLENLVLWEKQNVNGIARKIKIEDTKSIFNTKLAPKAFREILTNCDCKYILLSYNNTGKSLHSRSNALLTDNFIIEELKKIGDLKIFSTNYKGYTTGKNVNTNNKERIFFCKIR